MTVVNLTGLETELGAHEDIDRGRVSAQYWAGAGPFVNVAGEDVIFPAEIVVAIVDGDPTAVLDLVPTGGVCCVRWVVESYNGGHRLERFTTMPAFGPVDFGDLPIVDPTTYAPVTDVSLVESIRNDLLDGLHIEKVTQAEYDAIPQPRPTDTLYVITL